MAGLTTKPIPLVLSTYGKLPLSKEFLRVRCFHGAAREFREWLDQGFDHAGAYLRSAAPACPHVDLGPPWWLLLYPDGHNEGVVATVRQSTDLGGARIFPYSVFTTIARKNLDASTSQALRQVLPVWQEMDEYADRMSALHTLEEYRAAVAAAELTPFDGGGAVEGPEGRIELERFASAICGEAEPATAFARLLWSIRSAYRAIAAGRIPGHRIPGLRLPLACGIDLIEQVAAWLGCLEESGFLAAGARTPPGVIFPGRTAGRASLWVIRRPALPRDFLMLVPAAEHGGHLYPEPELREDFMGFSDFMTAASCLVREGSTLATLGTLSLEDLGGGRATS